MGPKKKGGKSSPEGKKKAELLAKLQKEKEEEEKRLAEEEKRLALEAAKVLLREQSRRNKLLKSSCRWFLELRDVVEGMAWEKRKHLEWECYINCNNLPIAFDIPMINTYLFMLKMKNILWKVKNCFQMCPKLLNIIDTLDDYIDNPLGASYRRIENWKEVRNAYREVIQEGIDMMCYTLVRDLENNLTAIDLWTYQFIQKCDEFFVGIWAFGEYPKLTGYPDHDYNDIGLDITLPDDYVNKPVVLRVMKMTYNHLNDRCITNSCPSLPEEYDQDLYTSSTDWFLARVRLMQDFKVRPFSVDIEPWIDGMFFFEIINRWIIPIPEIRRAMIHNLHKSSANNALPDEEAEFIMKNTLYLNAEDTIPTIPVPIGKIIDVVRKNNDGDIVLVCDEEREGNIKFIEELIQERYDAGKGTNTFKSKSVTKEQPQRDESSIADQILEEMDTKYTERILWKQLETTVEPGEINLRKQNVIGNLFSVELFHLPEQEILLEDSSRLRTIRGKAALEHIDFNIKYVPPAIVEEKQEDEEGKERKREGDMINQLMKINLGLEENCLWFEPPALVQWDSIKECWTDDFIVEPKYNEEKQQFTFKAGKLGVFGFMVQRYSNLPYQTWDLRPESEDTVFFNLTASTVIIDFRIKKDQVCIVQIQNAPSSVLDHLINVYMDPPILIKKLKRFGLDLFPDYDTFHYVEGSTYKDIVLENHTYASIALFCTAYNFTWSRWNSFSGRNKIVFQLREAIDKNTTANYQMFLASIDRALIVDCTEVSPSFSENGIEGMDFYPDLYSVMCYHISDTARERVISTHPYLIQTVNTMLSSTRIFTFS